MANFDIDFIEFLILKDSNNTNIKGLSVNQFLTITTNEQSNQKSFGINNILGFQQIINLTTTKNLDVIDHLVFDDKEIKDTIDATLTQSFYISQHIGKLELSSISQIFDLNQTVTLTKSKAVIQFLTFNQIISNTTYFDRSVIQEIDLSQAAKERRSCGDKEKTQIDYVTNGPNSTGGDVF